MTSTGRMRRVITTRFQPSAGTWTLAELLAAVLLGAVTSRLLSSGDSWFAMLLLAFSVATRIAVVDYSRIGGLATSIVMFSGVLLIFVATFWTLS